MAGLLALGDHLGRHAHAIVPDLHAELAIAEPDDDLDGAGIGVTTDVEERLVGDPPEFDRDEWIDRALPAFDHDAHSDHWIEAGRRRTLLEQLRQVSLVAGAAQVLHAVAALGN